MQAKLESGNFDIVEMAPTVQCLTGNYRMGKNEYTIPYLEYFMNPKKENVWYSAYQSEEEVDFSGTKSEHYCRGWRGVSY